MEIKTKEDEILMEKIMDSLFESGGTSSGAEKCYIIAKEYADQFKPKWISVEDKEPELLQIVLFVVVNNESWFYNGKIYLGAYQGFRPGYHSFRMPGGITFEGSHWMPISEFRKEDKNELE